MWRLAWLSQQRQSFESPLATKRPLGPNELIRRGSRLLNPSFSQPVVHFGAGENPHPVVGIWEHRTESREKRISKRACRLVPSRVRKKSSGKGVAMLRLCPQPFIDGENYVPFSDIENEPLYG